MRNKKGYPYYRRHYRRFSHLPLRYYQGFICCVYAIIVPSKGDGDEHSKLDVLVLVGLVFDRSYSFLYFWRKTFSKNEERKSKKHFQVGRSNRLGCCVSYKFC